MNMFYRLLVLIGVLGGLLTGVVSAQQNTPNLPLIGVVDDYPQSGYNDCWGYIAPDGSEYALLGVSHGTSIINITDTTDMHEVAFIPSANILWKDIKTYRNYAYVVTDLVGSGLQIIDLSNLPASATLVNTYRGNSFDTSHNIFIDTLNAVLYADHGNDVVRVLDISDPVNPVQISTFGLDCHDIYVQDNIAYVSEEFASSVGFYDVSDPSNPTFITRLQMPDGGVAHNAWVTADGNYMMTTQETSGLPAKMWDIRNLNNIVFLDNYLAAQRLAHNIHIKGNYGYLSHYRDGLRILNISDPSNLIEEGFYDTHSGPGGSFAGAWGTYPYFPSGKVLISGDAGLTVVFFQGAVESTTDIPLDAENAPQQFVLDQNYPNPFNPTTDIRYSLSVNGSVKLAVYDNLGRKIRTLVNQQQPAGSHVVSWDGRSDTGAAVVSGVYYYTLTSEAFSATRKMMLIK